MLTTGGMEPMRPSIEAATYPADGASVDLRQPVGQRIEVTGTIRSASAIASMAAARRSRSRRLSCSPLRDVEDKQKRA